MLENRGRVPGSNLEVRDILYNSSALKRLQTVIGSYRIEHLPGLYHQYLSSDYLRRKYSYSVVLDEEMLSSRLQDVAKRGASPFIHVERNFFTVRDSQDQEDNYPIPDALVLDEIKPSYYQLTKVVESRLKKVTERGAKELRFPRSLDKLLNLLNIPIYKTAFEKAINLELGRPVTLTFPRNFEGFYLLIVPRQAVRISRNSQVALEILPYSRKDVHNVVRTLTS